jgi:glycosyltransferase involved in cell wall biosynthesis
MQRAEANQPHQPHAPLVSVIIPCYNQAHYLGEAIESVINQTYPRCEIIVVDDGSTDNTAEVAARYKEVRCIRQQNQGLSAARNSGLRESKGEFLVFLDSDDRLLPEAIETGLKYLQERPECAFVSGHYRLIDSEGEPGPPEPQHLVEKDHYLTLLRKNYIIAPASVVYRREVFDAVGSFDTSLRSSEDYDIYLRIARTRAVHCHGGVVAEYRRHTSNMSSNSERMLKYTLAVHRAQRPHVKGNESYERAYWDGERFWKEFYGGRLVNEGRQALRRKEFKKAGRAFYVLLRHNPKEFFMQAYRKLYCVVFRVKSDMAEGRQG